MDVYRAYSLNLTENQIQNITRAKAKGAPVSVRLSNDALDGGNTDLMLNNTQINQIKKSIDSGKGLVLNLSATQIRYQNGEGLRETGQKIKKFFQNDVKNFFEDEVPGGLKALSKNGLPGVIGYTGARIAEAEKNRRARRTSHGEGIRDTGQKIKNFFHNDVKNFFEDDVPGAISNTGARIIEADKNRRARRTGGAIDPMTLMAGVGAIAPAIGDVAQTVGKYSNEQAKRGFAKNQITGKYQRKMARNMRAMQRRAQKHYRRLIKLRNKGKMANLSDQQIWDMARKTFLPGSVDVQTLDGPVEEDDDDEYEDDVPQDDDEAVELYGGMLGRGLFLHGRGHNKKNY
jgi:hypothetical protein